MSAKANRRARQPGAAANGHRRSNQPSREQLHRENERLLRELEDLRRKVAEQDRQIAEREKQIADAEKQIADAEKQIADLERQLAGRKKNSTNSSKPPSSDGLALPFTHNRRWTKSLISQRKPEAHELKCGVALPDQLMTGRWVVVASEISADLRDQAYRFTQQHGWLQAFFFA